MFRSRSLYKESVINNNSGSAAVTNDLGIENLFECLILLLFAKSSLFNEF